MHSVRRLSVLAVTSELPWPLNTGGRLRTFHVLRALAAAFDVRLVVPVEVDDPASIAAVEGQSIRVVAAPVSKRTILREALRLAQARRDGEPYVLYRRHARAAVLEAWHRELEQRPDVLHLDHLDSFVYGGAAESHRVPAVLDLHNIYSLVIRRLADESPSILKRTFLRSESKRLAKTEARACRSGATILAVSTAEAAHFSALGARTVAVVPNGVDSAAFDGLPTGRTSAPPTLLYLGTLSWGPNVAAAKYLAQRIFPRVRDRYPDARLLLVGKEPAAEIRRLAQNPGVEVAASVPSIQPYLERASLLAVPLDSGGGTRLKILEAFAAGLPVVSTAVGAEGIDAKPGHEIVIAERESMAAAILDLVSKPAVAQRLATNARALARQTYDWRRIGDTVVQCVGDVALGARRVENPG